MSGHSKWSTIKRQKGLNDNKRGQLFTKLSKAISIAVQQGGGVGDPDGNFRLRLAVEAARAANMPKENIERAIQRASGKQDSKVDELTYEGFGPGGFSVIVETLTDNKQRTISDVKSTFDKNGGVIGVQGSVLYQFEKKGSITVSKNGKSLDEIFMIAVEGNADDIEEVGDEVLIYTSPEDLAKARNLLLEQGLQIKSAELIWKPTITSVITEKEAAVRALSFLEKLESLDDVQKVYANIDIPDEVMNHANTE